MTMWEDGVAGIYKLATSSNMQVKRKHELVDSDATQLVEGLVEKTLDHARKSVLSQTHTRVVNTPKMLSRAAALKSVMDDMDGIESEIGGGGDDGSKSVATGVLPSVPAPVRGNGNGGDEFRVPGRMTTESLFQSLKPAVPQPEAKIKAKPKGKAKATANKRGSDTPVEEQPKRPRLIVSMEPQKTGAAKVTPATTAGVAEALVEADRQWFISNQETMRKVMQVFPSGSDDSAIKKGLTEACSNASKLLTSIRARKRSLKRRTQENGEAALTDAQGLEEILSAFLEFIKLVQKPTSTSCGNIGDLCYSKMIPLQDQNAKFAPSIFKVVAKLMWLDDLKWKRWQSMSDVTFKFLQRNCPEMDCAQFMLQNMNVNLQKLLKAIPVEKAWFGVRVANHLLLALRIPHVAPVASRNIARYAVCAMLGRVHCYLSHSRDICRF